MAPRNPDETKRRIFAAAIEEFARHGIAGARIDRVAERASANKQLIYACFGSKQELFDEVIGDQVTRFHEEGHLDPADVPAFAGAAFDFFADNLAIVRLAMWHSLEPAQADERVEAIERSIDERLRALRRARACGDIGSGFTPGHLLAGVYPPAPPRGAHTPECHGLRKSRPAQNRPTGARAAI